ncbi:MAG: hypothetical protein A2X12_00270 [Bacteroidetes bacterium GWE2_29_8]|nr:MAG: hypothetical protein A2X12_00270 [Bacteroidetes bacterium GWE2_29_8]OFY19356.1 MAG: hypothetical protein A2X02_04740 [Bacteroidetes bacterium GWF2_29_10]
MDFAENILKKNTPTWFNLSFDIFVCIISIITAYFLRFNFHIPEKDLNALPSVIIYVAIIRGITFIIGRTHAVIFRYTSTNDALRIFFVIFIGSIIFGVVNLVSYKYTKVFIIPMSIIIIDFIVSLLGLLSIRVFVKIMYLQFDNPDRKKLNVILYGAGKIGVLTKKALERDAGIKYNIISFIDDSPNKIGKILEDIKILDTKNIDSILKANQPDQLIISSQSLNPSNKKIIIEACIANNINILTVPPVSSWINGELSYKQFKQIKIEDVLEREEIKLNEDIIRKVITGKRILITGAAGSIGSELTKQVIKFSPSLLILLDQAETPLYILELELEKLSFYKKFEIVVASLNNKEKLESVFETFKPEIVFHAAAYKHVPMMEKHPDEAVMVNIVGTMNIADLSNKYNVFKFVMVSTDKAVNPTNIMGATKRLAEMYIQSFNSCSKTSFITTRFGNVLGSNGSVIPLFKKQIESGGPITITHPDVTRFFMTIPEASQLVLQAGSMGNGGEIFIFDMGKSVKIIDLAKKMIKLYGLEIGKDIQIVFTGLRAGEKLYEELLADSENTVKTDNSDIMIAKVIEYDFDYLSKEINELIGLINTFDNTQIVKKIKEIVPEFKSKNSIFAKLDD